VCMEVVLNDGDSVGKVLHVIAGDAGSTIFGSCTQHYRSTTGRTYLLKRPDGQHYVAWLYGHKMVRRYSHR
jgi:hypothetical protein